MVARERGEAGAPDPEESLRERVDRWLAAQLPIIRMHGGESAVRVADPDEGRVVVELGGACSGCSISPRTTQNIKIGLADEFPEVDEVIVRIANDDGGWEREQAESFMGIDRSEGGRGGRGESSSYL